MLQNKASLVLPPPQRAAEKLLPLGGFFYSSANNGRISPPPLGSSCSPHRYQEGPVPPGLLRPGAGEDVESLLYGHLERQGGREGRPAGARSRRAEASPVPCPLAASRQRPRPGGATLPAKPTAPAVRRGAKRGREACLRADPRTRRRRVNPAAEPAEQWRRRGPALRALQAARRQTRTREGKGREER